MSEPRTKLLLVDDHAVVRIGLAALFATVPRFVVVGEASSAAEAIVQARRHRPDVAIVDVRLPDMSGIEACRAIRSELPDTRVVMLSTYAEDLSVVDAILAGASGFLLKNTEPDRLIDAIETAARGGSLLDPAVTSGVLGYLRRAARGDSEPDPFHMLSEQERRILPLIARGMTNREIAAALVLSEHTVKTYISDMFKKLGLRRRSEAAAFIARRGQPDGG